MWGDAWGILWWGSAAGTLEPLAYTRVKSSRFSYPNIRIIPYIRPPPLCFSRCLPETTEVTSTVQPKQNRFDLIFFIVLSGNSQFPYRLKSSTNWSVSWKMIPCSRPTLSDLNTQSKSKLLENYTLHSWIYLYSPYMAVPPTPIGLSTLEIGAGP